MINKIIKELKDHIGFTLCGAVLGIGVIIVLQVLVEFDNIEKAKIFFHVIHPLHVVLSGLATASIYRHKTSGRDRDLYRLAKLFIIGYSGAIGIATVSDSVMPYLGELMIGLEDPHIHIGIIEEPVHVILAAFAGIAIAWYFPYTGFPHAGHVLLSTAASMFHILMAAGSPFTTAQYLYIMIILFLSVWIPCCISDIVFPMLFVKDKKT